MFRRLVPTAIVAAGLILGATTAPASAARSTKVQLLQDETAAVTAGSTTWLNISWLATRGTAEDFHIVAQANRGATVDYSETTSDHAGPLNGYQLAENETDFTAIKLTVPDTVTQKKVTVTIQASWTENGKSKTKAYTVKVPVVQHSGDDWTLVDNSATAVDGWVEFKVTGLAPRSEGLKFEMTNDASTDAYLPQGTWTGPHHDSLLEMGETDMVRFYVEPGSVEPGEYEMTLTGHWTSKAEAKTDPVGLTVIIE